MKNSHKIILGLVLIGILMSLIYLGAFQSNWAGAYVASGLFFAVGGIYVILYKMI